MFRALGLAAAAALIAGAAWADPPPFSSGPHAFVRTMANQPGAAGFLDMNTVQRRGDIAMVEVLVVPVQTDEEAYLRSHYEVNCRTQQVFADGYFYDNTGAVTSQVERNALDVRSDENAAILCGRASAEGLERFDSIDRAISAFRHQHPVAEDGPPRT